MEIYFQNFSNFIIKPKIQKIYDLALTELNLDKNIFSVNLNFVKKEEIKELNKNFRQIDKPTDVLSFPNLNFSKGQYEITADDISIEDGLVCLGDIAICKEIAKMQAKEYGHSFKREVCFLALHGLLHLLGFDHISAQDEKEMQKLAEKILQKEKVKRKNV